MHLTKIVLKDGRKFADVMPKIGYDPNVFENSYIELSGNRFYVRDIASAITENERVSKTKIGDIDEIEEMRKQWEEYKSGKDEGLRLVDGE